MNEEIYFVRIEGTKPLLMNNPYSQIGVVNKPTRRRGEQLPPEKEAELLLYKDEKSNIVVPARVIKACIRSASRNYKAKQRKMTYAGYIRAGIDIEPENIPLIHNGWKPFVTLVRVQGSRILRARPRFDVWALEFKLINKDPNMINMDTLRQILEDAGKYYGIGDYRPEFGLFKVVKFEKIAQEVNKHENG